MWAPDYLDQEEAADFLNLGTPSDEEAADLAVFIPAASRAIDRACGRQFGAVETPQERFYTPRWSRTRGRWMVRIDDLMSTTGLVVTVRTEDGTELGAATYTLEPRNAAADGVPWTDMALLSSSAVLPGGAGDEMGITAEWGWTAFPDVVTAAAKLQLSRFWARRQSPFGIAGSPDQGNELRLLERLDPDVAVMLRSVRRLGVVAR
jgi:hypothetical protein